MSFKVDIYEYDHVISYVVTQGPINNWLDKYVHCVASISMVFRLTFHEKLLYLDIPMCFMPWSPAICFVVVHHIKRYKNYNNSS